MPDPSRGIFGGSGLGVGFEANFVKNAKRGERNVLRTSLYRFIKIFKHDTMTIYRGILDEKRIIF